MQVVRDCYTTNTENHPNAAEGLLSDNIIEATTRTLPGTSTDEGIDDGGHLKILPDKMTRFALIKNKHLAPSEYAMPCHRHELAPVFFPSNTRNKPQKPTELIHVVDVCNDNDITQPKKVNGELQNSGDNDTGDTVGNRQQSGSDQQGNQVQHNSQQHFENVNETQENANNQDPGSLPTNGTEHLNEIETYIKTLINITRIKLMCVGHIKAGKTCLKESLLGKPFRDTGRTEGIDVTTCSIDITSSENWKEVPDNLTGLYEEVEALKAEIMLPDGGATSGYESGQSRIYESTRQNPEIKMWDMAGEFGYYCSHQMFLDPQCIYLVVMDASKDLVKLLDAEIPLSHATEDQAKKIHCPRKMYEFLDYWLDNICTFINPGLSTEELPSIAIVLTHTDNLGPAAEDIISEYREQIEKHIQNKYAVRFVYKHIFAVSNKERCEETFHELRKTILEMAERKNELSKNSTIPFVWMLIEAEIRKYSETTNKKCFTINEIKSQVLDKNGLPLKECKDFLKFQHSIRRMIFVNANDQTDHEEFESLVITDPQYVVDVFRSVIALWHGLSNETTSMSLYQKLEIKNNIKDRNVSLKHLHQVWENLLGDNITTEHLAWMLYKFNQIFLTNGTPWNAASIYQNIDTKFTIPVLLPPSPAEVLDTSTSSCKLPLIYYFYLAQSFSTIGNSTSFLPVGFLPILASRLANCEIDGQPWNQRKLYFNTAEFITGKYHDFLLILSTHQNAIFVNVFPANGATFFFKMGCIMSYIRNQIERYICEVMSEMCPQLKCAVCVSPCYSGDSSVHPSRNAEIHNQGIRINCLSILRPIQEGMDVQMPLKIPICREHEKEKSIADYECWFCSEAEMVITSPDKILRAISGKVPNEFRLRELFGELNIPCERITQCLTNNPQQINLVTYRLLREWLDSKVGGFSHGSGAWSELKNALESAHLPSPNQIMAEL